MINFFFGFMAGGSLGFILAAVLAAQPRDADVPARLEQEGGRL
jgi:hypothetical protein